MEEVSCEGAGTVCILIIYLDADITWRTLVSSVFPRSLGTDHSACSELLLL